MSHRTPPELPQDSLRTEPVSRSFGLDLGTSICRYYLEKFLSIQSTRIRGRVLEIGDDAYTRRFGRGVAQSDVLHAAPSEQAAFVGDLSEGDVLPAGAFDCIILTQTIQCIYRFKQALRHAYRALKPDGALLLSASGISQISRYDMDRWGEFWRFTDKAIDFVLRETCPGAQINIQTWGNLASSKGYLDGIPAESFPAERLDVQDRDYQMLLTACVVRPAEDIVPLVPKPAGDGWIDLLVPDNLDGLREFAEKNRNGAWRTRFRNMTVHCTDLLALYTAAKDIFLNRIYDFQAEVTDPLIIDGGAHIGLFTLRAKHLYPQGRVIAFEPNPESLALLRLNIEANRLDKVKIVESGLLDREDRLPFTSKTSDGSTLFSGDLGSEISVTRLSPWLDRTVDMLKLNIEGAEYPVLVECGERLRRVRKLVLEYHAFPELGDQLHNILSTMHGQGFRYAVHDFDSWTNPATKPPFSIDADTRYYLCLWGANLQPRPNESSVAAQ